MFLHRDGPLRRFGHRTRVAVDEFATVWEEDYGGGDGPDAGEQCGHCSALCEISLSFLFFVNFASRLCFHENLLP